MSLLLPLPISDPSVPINNQEIYPKKLTHRMLSSFNNGLSFARVHDNFFNLVDHFISHVFTILCDLYNFGIHRVIADNLDQLWEMISVPFSMK